MWQRIVKRIYGKAFENSTLLICFLSIILILFHKIEFKNQPKSIPLTKPQSSYKKLEKEMNQPPSDYNSIKSLVENDNNSLKNIDIKKSKNEVKIIPHKKK